MSASNMNFRYDIAFLRAVAVLFVVLYHLGIPFAKDGYIGVDIFFVLSGYLMTRIILGGMSQNNFSLVDFYRRRLVRILPALLILIIFFSILLYFVLGIKLYDFSQFAFSSSIFVSNFYYYLSSGYFQPASQLNFLLHTWSLSIEWQFYIIYPLLLMGFRRLAVGRFRRDGYLLYGLFFLSLAFMFYHARQSQSFTFYMFHTRAWELLAGGIVFLHEKKFRQFFSQSVRNGISIGCIAVILLSLIGVLGMRSVGWPSAFTLVPVGCTAMLILSQSRFRLFKLPVVNLVANISYSWYLWHWPLIVLGTYFSLSQYGVYRLAVFALSFAMGALSYHFVEKGSFLHAPKRLLATAALVVVATFLGTQIPLHKLFINPQESNLIAFQYRYPRKNAAEQFGFNSVHLLSRSAFEDFDTTRLLQFTDSRPNYLLLGDCHAGMFAHTLRKLADVHDVNLLQATGDDTFPAPRVQSPFEGPTALMHYIYNDYVPVYRDKIDKVILSANYAGYSKQQVEEYLKTIDAYFAQHNIPVVYIGQTESYTIEYPVVETLRLKFGIAPERYLQGYRTHANNYLKASAMGDKYIDVYRRSTLKSANDKESYMYDADHFSVYGTEQYADLFEKEIFLGSMR